MNQPKIYFKGNEYEIKEIEWKNGDIKKIRFYIGDGTRVIFQSDNYSELTEDPNFGYFHAPNLNGFIA